MSNAGKKERGKPDPAFGCIRACVQSPEFADMTARLATLEERLDQMVQPRLTDALKQRMVRDLSCFLLSFAPAPTCTPWIAKNPAPTCTSRVSETRHPPARPGFLEPGTHLHAPGFQNPAPTCTPRVSKTRHPPARPGFPKPGNHLHAPGF